MLKELLFVVLCFCFATVHHPPCKMSTVTSESLSIRLILNEGEWMFPMPVQATVGILRRRIAQLANCRPTDVLLYWGGGHDPFVLNNDHMLLTTAMQQGSNDDYTFIAWTEGQAAPVIPAMEESNSDDTPGVSGYIAPQEKPIEERSLLDRTMPPINTPILQPTQPSVPIHAPELAVNEGEEKEGTASSPQDEASGLSPTDNCPDSPKLADKGMSQQTDVGIHDTETSNKGMGSVQGVDADERLQLDLNGTKEKEADKGNAGIMDKSSEKPSVPIHAPELAVNEGEEKESDDEVIDVEGDGKGIGHPPTEATKKQEEDDKEDDNSGNKGVLQPHEQQQRYARNMREVTQFIGSNSKVPTMTVMRNGSACFECSEPMSPNEEGYQCTGCLNIFHYGCTRQVGRNRACLYCFQQMAEDCARTTGCARCSKKE